MNSAPAPALQLSLYADRRPTAAERAKNSTGARLEPDYGCYLGAYLDLDSQNKSTYTDETGKVRRRPAPFEAMAGKKHATYFLYLGYGHKLPLDWAAMLSRQGKIVHIALEPNNGLDQVQDDEYLNTLAEQLNAVGGPVFVRFASEMNGPWVKYHGTPKQYQEKFKVVAEIMHKKAKNVAMVWCPYTTPIRPIPSYYPGDEAVDWVGVNFYSVTYYNQNRSEPAAHVNPIDKLDYIYDRYSAKKPIMIAEYGATHFSALENKTVEPFAIGCIASLYRSLPRKYPRVKAINYFNANNMELDHRMNNNYSVTQSDAVLKAYKKAVAPSYYLSSTPSESRALNGGKSMRAPMPIKSGQIMYGDVDISAWAKVHRGDYAMKFLVNNKEIYTADSLEGWHATIRTAAMKNGPATITARLLKGGKTVASTSVSVRIDN
jgi:hypothetical protein